MDKICGYRTGFPNVNGKVFPVLLSEHHAIKEYWGSGGIDPHILDLGTRWR
jgi:hypothetical protein